MIFEKTHLEGVYIITPEKKEDERGFFQRVLCKKEMAQMGIDFSIVNINSAYNKKTGTLRGLHKQLPPYEETKLIHCVKGRIYDVAVDTRENSKTFGQYVGVELSDENNKMLLVPKGYSHGYLTLCDDCQLVYYVDEYYAPDNEIGYKFDDKVFAINWPINVEFISKKDDEFKYC